MTLSIQELTDLYDAIMERIPDELLGAITRANHSNELTELLKLIGMEDLLPNADCLDISPKRVVVLGSSMISEGQLKSLVRRYGFDTQDFEFVLEYRQIQRYNFSKLRYSSIYKAVLVGPIPHSSSGSGSHSSAITNMESHPEIYPPVIRLRANDQKITKNSFKEGLEELSLLQ